MNAQLADLYQEIILRHHKSPHNCRALPEASHRSQGRNPVCGDEVEIYLNIEGGHIRGVTFQGQACAITRASASMLTEALLGKTTGEATAFAETLLKELRAADQTPEAPAHLNGDLRALFAVGRFPARIPCATLPWITLKAALAGQPRTLLSPSAK
ncbi:MAG: SUF system NifU family Fe-S cluster assembly protein [Opitutales bacterium]|nr:SUF system NifU family Fe-S cluster assembly protein [Opitutales bacterium]